jgi:hypothetical protein
MQETPDKRITIKTSEEGWLARLAHSYRKRQPILLVDDAKVGIDPTTQSILDMGRRAELGVQEWAAVLVALGMVGAGIWMTVAAVLDPEPTSKLGLLVTGGIVCTVGGGFSAIRILTRHKPPSVKLTRSGVHIQWD